MVVLTDSPEYACTLLPGIRRAREPAPIGEGIELLASRFLPGGSVAFDGPPDDAFWKYVIASGFARESQYDRMIRTIREGVSVPGGLACVARTGLGFQGFHGRSWVAEPGNIHLTAHFAPMRPIPRFETVLMALAAVSVVETIDSLPGLQGRAGIKWVNDVLIEGAKVAGVLAYSQTRGSVVTSIVLGVGLNVERSPSVPPTPFVPAAGSLRDFVAEGTLLDAPAVLRVLLRVLARNYLLLLDEGFPALMRRYRDRSVIVGREVAVSSDDPDEVPRVFAAGRVLSIGDGLELFLDGAPAPITRGRLILPADSPAEPSFRPQPETALT